MLDRNPIQKECCACTACYKLVQRTWRYTNL